MKCLNLKSLIEKEPIPPESSGHLCGIHALEIQSAGKPLTIALHEIGSMSANLSLLGRPALRFG